MIEEFNDYRARMNERILAQNNLVIKRFWSLDNQTYQEGALDVKTKEMLGLVASMVLRCDDCIKYHLGKPLRKDNITEYVEDLFQLEKTLTKQDSLVIVMKAEMNDTNVATLSQIWEQSGIHIVIFSLDRLQFNILEHTYVPKHTILTEEETQEMMTLYNIAHPDMLPNISRYDPVAMAIGMRPGQVCRIDRFSKTAVSTPYYRICTPK